jgi:hypothetical protein
VTTSRTPRPEPGGPRPKTFDDRRFPDSGARTTRLVAVAALVLSIVGLGLAAWHAIAPPDSSCQEAAWATTPDVTSLPTGWSVASSQYDIARKSMSLLGPAPVDQTVSQAVVYTTITCYPVGAAEAVTRSADAATAAGQAVVSRNDLGDQGFSAVDDSGAVFLQFRHDRLVVYLAASGEATPAEVDDIASAFDIALGGDGGAVAVGTPDASAPASTEGTPAPTAAATDGGSASPAAAPELESALPVKVGTTTLTVDSATGSMILGEDQGSRAITAALRAEGKQPDDLKVAQAYDETAESDLSILAVAVNGLPAAKVFPIVLDSWLAATGAGVTQDKVTLGGIEFTRVDYGDKGALDYVGTKNEVVIVITTSDPAVAAAAAAALP